MIVNLYEGKVIGKINLFSTSHVPYCSFSYQALLMLYLLLDKCVSS